MTDSAGGSDGAPETPASLAIGDGWTERTHREGSFGPDDRSGRVVALERDSTTVSAVPVRFARGSNRERIEPLVGTGRRSDDEGADDIGTDGPFERAGPAAVADDVPERTAFATIAAYRPADRIRRDVVCVAADADDAVAAAAWLTRGSATDPEMDRNLRLHRGERTAASDVSVSDDDALGALFRAEPDRCVVTGQPTRSHRIALPYRYVTALRNAKRTSRGVVRIPGTVRSLVGAVSHGAWEERGFGDVAFDEPLERTEAGVYRLDGDVLDAVTGLDASNFSLRRLGEDED